MLWRFFVDTDKIWRLVQYCGTIRSPGPLPKNVNFVPNGVWYNTVEQSPKMSALIRVLYYKKKITPKLCNRSHA